MTPTIVTNYDSKAFEVHVDGVLLFASKNRAAAVEVLMAHGGEVEQPKQMSRTAARRMESAGRGNSGGWGQSRSSKK